MTRAATVVLLIYSMIPALFLNGCLSSLREADTLGDEAARAIRHISTDEQLRELKKLDSREDVERFLSDFWANLDPTPGTPENEVKQEYDRRFQYSEEHFRESNLRGSQTDRGRVYIIYGPPAEIYLDPMVREDFDNIGGFQIESWMTEQSEPEFKMFRIRSVIVWEYDRPASRGKTTSVFSRYSSSKLTFVFADFDGYGAYTQVYSTAEGEIDDTRLMMGPVGPKQSQWKADPHR
ncbi:MAG: GWxTD domain-containing protein [candidate division Zixibacteria bacterium]|nr:GWxTD domain-containing protein [candidate division Zixibacteria bacterium]MBU1471689.1 GWxTD domain-containing protein [candidate division Zixibacteria bacterium]MBU2625415.1 GWxTD domain-containing protein [candidate division Zixibacteria bacterium]